MQRRALGRSGLELPKVVLGGMFRDPSRRREELARLLDAALDTGIDALDTAPLYGFGEAEQLLGHWLAGRRERVLVLGKVGLRWDDGYGETLFETSLGGRRVAVRRDSRPEAIVRDLEASLRRLGTDRIDLVQIHHRDRRTPLADSLGALARLRDAGKLRAIGVCNFDAPDVAEAQRALGSDDLASVQGGYNLIERGLEREVLPRVRETGLGFLAYSPLARGILGGRLRAGPLPASDGRSAHALYQGPNARMIHRVLDERVSPLAEARRVDVAAIALAWVMGQPGVTAAICGAQDRHQLEAARAAAEIVLDAAERRLLSDIFAALPLERGLGTSWRGRLVRRLRRAWARRVG